MIDRQRHRRALQSALRTNRVVAILGARQVGKSTLARGIAKSRSGRTTTFDLEDPRDLAQLAEPMLALRPLSGLVILDEVQRVPELFAPLRVLADRPRGARFLVLGSASPTLLRQTSESLAGRIAYHQLGGFALDEIGESEWQRLWLRGGFPRSYLSDGERTSVTWRQNFVRTFVERDLSQLALGIPASTLERFWAMLAHYHGQVWNASELARAFGVSQHKVGRYLDILTGTFVVRRLAPWHENLSKRQVRAPKIYIADSGMLHALLGLRSWRDLARHPKVGASFEGFVVNEVATRLDVNPEECFFWGTHAGAELDLLVVRGRRRLGFEIKFTEAPRVTPSMRTALVDLGLERLDVVHAGSDTYPLSPRIRAVAVTRLLHDLKPLR